MFLALRTEAAITMLCKDGVLLHLDFVLSINLHDELAIKNMLVSTTPKPA